MDFSCVGTLLKKSGGKVKVVSLKVCKSWLKLENRGGGVEMRLFFWIEIVILRWTLAVSLPLHCLPLRSAAFLLLLLLPHLPRRCSPDLINPRPTFSPSRSSSSSASLSSCRVQVCSLLSRNIYSALSQNPPSHQRQNTHTQTHIFIYIYCTYTVYV